MTLNYYEGSVSVEYSLALIRANNASAEFRNAQIAYRAHEIDDAAFLKAKAAHNKAQAEFDIAFTRESA